MKKITLILLASGLILFNSCASGYKKINPQSLNYLSKNITNDIVLEYKYDLLNKKYKKKETANDIKVVSIKITNNSNNDVVFGKDVRLAFENGNEALIMENERVFKTIKQSPASYLWYLLLSPLQLYKTQSSGPYGQPVAQESFPIGLIVGPGIAFGNMIGAASANANFKNELFENNLIGKTIKKGEIAYGIIGIQSTGYEALKLKQ
ncbi:hypothetical protein [Flavobacterium sp.]|uniref:hypothetical protein n=1 Tax=Flavobacterium sp. TaxID=239 RepID=UPI00286E0EBD|nr:hypothetical protein [Flavobacterium sp.]